MPTPIASCRHGLPKSMCTVSGQRNLEFAHKDGVVTFRLDLAEADYVILANGQR